MVATFGFDDFAVVRVFVLFNFASTLGAGSFYCAAAWSFGFGFWIQQSNDVTQGLGVFAHQGAQFAFEFQLGLQFVVLGQVLQTGLQLFDSFFGGAIFVDQGHVDYLMLCAGWQMTVRQ
ncbi:hypothetical protein D3C86_1548520 [compost metagenome]